MPAKPKQGQTAKRLAQVQKDLKGVRFAWDFERRTWFIVSPYSGKRYDVSHVYQDGEFVVSCQEVKADGQRAPCPSQKHTCWHEAVYLAQEPYDTPPPPDPDAPLFELNLPDGPVRWTGHGAEWEPIESPSRGRSQLFREG